jgi:hypothetical protein
MAARLLHGVVESLGTNVDVPLSCGLALLLQVSAVPPDPRGRPCELSGRQPLFVLGFRAAIGGQVIGG